ncbi:NPCBM/NEW2 domain-containing protein [Streptomyces sp. NPDC057136]|uniref:NPCBM/NEW2 domain-containing protein n=1 Tax=Streptomyces sp. NPDC057136 TaxID=3346029 RepID=UPI003632751E
MTVAEAVPAGASYLSDTRWVKSTNGWGSMERDMTNGGQDTGDGTALRIGGTVNAKGLGTHAFYTAGRCTKFTAPSASTTARAMSPLSGRRSPSRCGRTGRNP